MAHNNFLSFAWLMGLLLCLQLWSCGPSTPEYVEAPVVVAHPQVPQLALLKFKADEPVRALVKMTDGKYTWDLKPPGLYKTEMEVPFFQLRPDTEYRFTIQMIDTRKNVSPPYEEIVYRTPALPAHFPTFSIDTIKANQREPGFTLLSITDERITKHPLTNWLIALDREGQVMWYTETEQPFYELQACRGGTIIGLTQGNQFWEFNWRAEFIRKFVCTSDGLAPEGSIALPIELADFPSLVPTSRRTYLTLTKDPTDAEDKMGRLVEFKQDGEIVREWNLGNKVDFEALEEGEEQAILNLGNGFVGLAANENTNLVYTIAQGKNTILGLDLAQDSLRWLITKDSARIITEGITPLSGAPMATEYPIMLHSTPYQSLLVVDQALMGNTRILEYEINEAQNTFQQSWSYEAQNRQDFSAHQYSDIQRLHRTGNVLFHGIKSFEDGWQSTLREFSHDTIPELLVELVFDQDIRLNSVLHLSGLKMKMEGE